MFNEDSHQQQNCRNAYQRQLASQAVLSVMMLMMMLVRTTFTLMMFVMMNMCHNFDPLNNFRVQSYGTFRATQLQSTN